MSSAIFDANALNQVVCGISNANIISQTGPSDINAPSASLDFTYVHNGIIYEFIGNTSLSGASYSITVAPAAPTVTSIAPTAGPATGGTSVTVTGTDFTGATAVAFGATPATGFTVDSATQITATSPAGTGTVDTRVDIRVTTVNGTSATGARDKFLYMAAPTVNLVSPTSGSLTGGTSVTIQGFGFTGATAVVFGATPATGFTVDSDNQITATSPAGTGTVDIRVTTVNGTSATGADDQFIYIPPPIVTSIDTTSGPEAGNTVVRITGSDLGSPTAVTFGATPAQFFFEEGLNRIKAGAPAGTGTVDIRVTTASGTSATSAADQYTYVPAPTLTSISPNSGPTAGGTAVTITGTNFTGATSIRIGGAATVFTVVNATTITATTPAHAAGAVNVAVATPGGSDTGTGLFSYAGVPTVTAITPTTGGVSGGTAVSITGTNFSGATAVKFGASNAASFVVGSATGITAVSSAGTAGTVDITVTTPSGSSVAGAADRFTYTPAPVLQVTPASGISASGKIGGPFTPNAFSYQLSASSGTVDFSITGTPDWLDVSTTSGTATTAPTTVTFTVNASANSLARGSYGPVTVTFSNASNGPGSQSRPATLAVGINSIAHDFDADGKSDVLWRDGGGNVAQWLMNGGAIVANNLIGNVPTSWSIVGQRDFNGDGNADLLWRDASGNVAMWLMNGKAISSAVTLGNIPDNWSVSATVDFNGDGKGDILWRDAGGNVAAWLMNGTTIASAVTLGNIPSNWSVVGAADFDGDGKGDILWRDTGGNLAAWFMNGTTIASVVTFGKIPANWSVVGTGDFDGNGKADILWRDSSGNVAVWFMNGASIASVVTLGNIPANWSVAQTGDYNGDGKADILWRDAGGNVAMWLMNGATVASAINVGNIPANWNVQGLNAD